MLVAAVEMADDDAKLMIVADIMQILDIVDRGLFV
jgi:hypothetical protein